MAAVLEADRVAWLLLWGVAWFLLWETARETDAEAWVVVGATKADEGDWVLLGDTEEGDVCATALIVEIPDTNEDDATTVVLLDA